jgi:hypothetical protein
MSKLYFNSATQVVFRSDDDQTGNVDVRQIRGSSIAGLVSSGASVDASAQSDYNDPSQDVEYDETVPNDDAVATGSPSATADQAVNSVPEESTESDPRLPPSDEQPSATVTYVTDPVSGETTVQTDTENPVVQEAPIALPVAPVQTPEEQAAAYHATVTQRAAEIASTPVVDPVTGTSGVTIPADNHASAKDRFAGLMAKLHQFEDESVEELKNDIRALGTLLHLHTRASNDAENNGDYTAGDTQ